MVVQRIILKIFAYNLMGFCKHIVLLKHFPTLTIFYSVPYTTFSFSCRMTRFKDSAESAESYPSRSAPRRVRVTSQSIQLRGDRLGRESELTRSTWPIHGRIGRDSTESTESTLILGRVGSKRIFTHDERV